MKNMLITLVVLAFAGTAQRADAQISLVSGTLEEFSVQGSAVQSGVIRVRNDTKQPQQARLYQTDYRFQAGGKTDYERAGTQNRSNAAWIALTPARLMIPPNGEALAYYTITVPAEAGTGTYWSMIMVEPVSPGSPEAVNAPKEKGMSLETSIRYGVQIATHIEGSATRLAELTNARIARTRTGERVLEFDVLNTGERAYRPRLTLELFSEGGASVHRSESVRGLIYPGSSVRQQFDVTKVRPGTYQVLILADTGGDDIMGARYTLKF